VLNNASDKKSVSKNGENGGSPSLPLKGNYTPPEAENVDIFRLLDQLEELPEKARRLPFSTLVGFDDEKFYYLVLKIRANLPEDMKKAQRVARDSERIVDEARGAALQQLESGRMEGQRALQEARAEAQRLIEEARAEAQRLIEEARAEGLRLIEEARRQAALMVDQSEIHRMATAQAHEILRRAEVEAAEIRKGADEYARDVLATIEGHMSKAIVTVQRGREMLEKSRC